jgi:hypothetical protein
MDAPDEVVPPRRRRSPWIVIPLGCLGLCLLICIALAVWGATDSGQDFFEDLGTSVAEEATEQAN